jgi:hypothetical protein
MLQKALSIAVHLSVVIGGALLQSDFAAFPGIETSPVSVARPNPLPFWRSPKGESGLPKMVQSESHI